MIIFSAFVFIEDVSERCFWPIRIPPSFLEAVRDGFKIIKKKRSYKRRRMLILSLITCVISLTYEVGTMIAALEDLIDGSHVYSVMRRSDCCFRRYCDFVSILEKQIRLGSVAVRGFYVLYTDSKGNRSAETSAICLSQSQLQLVK